MKRCLLRFLLITSTLAVVAAVHAPVASAATIKAFCAAGAFHQRFDPGLRYDVREIDVYETATWVGCVSTAKPEIHSLDFVFEGRGHLNCIGGTADGLVTLRWKTVLGRLVGTSTAAAEFAIVLRPNGQNVVVIALRIISGLFNGDRVVMDEVLLSNLIACLTPEGVRDQYGTGVALTVLG